MLFHVTLSGAVNLITVNAYITYEPFPAILYRQLRNIS